MAQPSLLRKQFMYYCCLYVKGRLTLQGLREIARREDVQVDEKQMQIFIGIIKDLMKEGRLK